MKNKKPNINKIAFNTGTNILNISNNYKSLTLLVNLFPTNVLKQNAENITTNNFKTKHYKLLKQ